MQQQSFEQWREIHRHNPAEAVNGIAFASAYHGRIPATSEEFFDSALHYIRRERDRQAAA